MPGGSASAMGTLYAAARQRRLTLGHGWHPARRSQQGQLPCVEKPRPQKSPGSGSGARASSTCARSVLSSIRPETTRGATIRSLRKLPTKVEVFQCPKGTLPVGVFPLGAQPRIGTKSVLIQVSSRKTSLSVRIWSLPGRQSSRSRSPAISVWHELSFPRVHFTRCVNRRAKVTPPPPPNFWCFGGEPVQSPRVSFFGRPCFSAFAGGPVAARWQSRCGGPGLRQAGRVAACPAAGCSRPQSSVCCVPIVPQVWPGMSNASFEALRAGMHDIHVVRNRFADLHSACSLALRSRGEAGDTAESVSWSGAGGQRPIMWVF